MAEGLAAHVSPSPKSCLLGRAATSHPLDICPHRLGRWPPGIAKLTDCLFARIPPVFPRELSRLSERERHWTHPKPLDSAEDRPACQHSRSRQRQQWTGTAALPGNQSEILAHGEPITAENIPLARSATLHRQHKPLRGVLDMDDREPSGYGYSKAPCQAALDRRRTGGHPVVQWA